MKASLDAAAQPPPIIKSPESEELGKDPLAGNKRFTFIVADTGKGTDEVCQAIFVVLCIDSENHDYLALYDEE